MVFMISPCPVDRSYDETAELTARVFELLQTIRQQWLTAHYPEKRRLLEIVFLNCTLDGATLCPGMRKPFDVLAKGLLISSSRGGRTPLELFLAGFRQWPTFVDKHGVVRALFRPTNVGSRLSASEVLAMVDKMLGVP
jgi:hypothetical protein